MPWMVIWRTSDDRGDGDKDEGRRDWSLDVSWEKIHVNYKNQTCMHVPWCNNYFIMLPHIEIQLRYDSNIQPIDQTKKIIT
jgi:hypothetical protein